MQIAVCKKDFKRTEELLQQGYYVDEKGKLHSTTALMRANDLEIIKLLVRYNAKLNIQDGFGKTALNYAIRNKNLAKMYF